MFQRIIFITGWSRYGVRKQSLLRVIRLPGDQDVFYNGLKRKYPDDAAQDPECFCLRNDFSFMEKGVPCVKWQGINVPEYNPEGYPVGLICLSNA